MNPLTFRPIAEAFAALSKDPSTRVGAVIVGPNNEIRSSGWNGFPRGVDDDKQRYSNREVKLRYVVHAEMNAICNAARAGTSTEGCSLVVTTLHPCNECAKAIIQAGIVKVYAPLPEIDGRWATAFEVAAQMFKESGVEVEWY